MDEVITTNRPAVTLLLHHKHLHQHTEFWVIISFLLRLKPRPLVNHTAAVANGD